MSVLIRLDPGVRGLDAGPIVPPTAAVPDERSTEFRRLEQDVVAEFERMATAYLKARGKTGGGVIAPGLADKSEVALDRSLLGGLCLRYVMEGWPGVAEVQGALMALAKKPGVVSAADLNFFCRTRDLLRRLISRTLIDLEAHAARLVLSGEQDCRAAVYKTQLALGVKSPQERIEAGTMTPDNRPGQYVMDNAERAARLHGKLLQLATVLRGVNEVLRAKAYVSRGRYSNESTIANFDRIAAETAREAGPFLQDPIFVKECPLGLLGIRLVELGTTREEMEHRLGSVLDRLVTSLDTLRKSAPGGRAERVIGPRAFRAQGGYDLTGGPELMLMTAAFNGMTKDRGWLPLVHQPTWERMVRDEQLPQGGFGFAVASQYLRELRARRRTQQAVARAEAERWRTIDRIASGLSLAAFVFAPVGGAVLRAAGWALSAASVVLLVHQVTATLEQATLADEKLLAGVGVNGPEARGADFLADLGEAAWFRQNVYGEVAGQIAISALAMFAGGRLPPAAREAIEHYGYLQDIKALMEPTHGEPEEDDRQDGERR